MLESLAYPLPTDLEMLYASGQFSALEEFIAARLADPLTTKPLRVRLEMTRALVRDLPDAYPYTRTEILTLLTERIPDFKEAELDALTRDRTLDWRLLNGQVHYRRNCISNLLRTRREFALREKDQSILKEETEEASHLEEMIRRIQRDGQVRARFEMQESLTIKSETLKEGEMLRLWLPLPIEEMPVTSCRILSTSHPAVSIAPASALQRTAYFEVPYEHGLTVSLKMTWETLGCDLLQHPEYAEKTEPGQEDLSEHLPHIAFTPYLRALAREIAGEETDKLKIARRIYDFITTKCVYRFLPPYMTVPNLTEYFLANQRGDCGVQALSFITLCRLCGIPARWQSGQYTAPFSTGMHDWARFYVAPYGWLFADCSFGGSGFRTGSQLRHDFYFGSMEPWRLPMARRFQAQFDPPTRYLRYDPYDNQCGEAEAVSRRLLSSEVEDEQTLTDYTLLT